MACIDTIKTEHIEYCPNQENPAGVSSEEIWVCSVKDFESIKEPKSLSVAVTLEEAGTISETHTFPAFTPPEAGKGFFKLNILPDTGNVVTTNEGEKGSKSNTNTFGGTLNGVSGRNIGFIRKYQNLPLIVIVTERSGSKRQIGSKINPAYMTEGNTDTGSKSGDVNGVTFKVSDTQSYPAPVYLGTITEFTPAGA